MFFKNKFNHSMSLFVLTMILMITTVATSQNNSWSTKTPMPRFICKRTDHEQNNSRNWQKQQHGTLILLPSPFARQIRIERPEYRCAKCQEICGGIALKVLQKRLPGNTCTMRDNQKHADKSQQSTWYQKHIGLFA